MTSTTAAALLWLLLALFVLRVAGQVIVALRQPRWLPEMRQWYSGLVPYPVLLPMQLAFILVMAAMARDVGRDAGPFTAPSAAWGSAIVAFSLVYAAAMGMRYARWRRTPPAERRAWIPIPFHLVLATFLFVYGRWLVG